MGARTIVYSKHKTDVKFSSASAATPQGEILLDLLAEIPAGHLIKPSCGVTCDGVRLDGNSRHPLIATASSHAACDSRERFCRTTNTLNHFGMRRSLATTPSSNSSSPKIVSPRILSYNRRRPSEEDLVPFPAQLERNLDS